GTLDAADAAAARRIAARMTAARDAAGEPPVSAGEVAALAAMDAVLHRLIDHERESGRADLGATVTAVGSSLGADALDEVDKAWRGQFRDDGRRAANGVAAGTPPSGPDLLAEVLVLAALNEDPAATVVRELVDDRPLRDRTQYEAVLDATERELGGRAIAGDGRAKRGAAGTSSRPRSRAATAIEGEDLPLPALLREPMLHAPGSLAAQLRWVRRHWRGLIKGDAALARRIDLALDVLAEEARAMELRAAGAHFGGPVQVETPDYRGLDADTVAFSADTDWMPSVVLMAKSTYVWLEQVAAQHERPIATLADVPDE